MKKIAFISFLKGDDWGGSEELWSQTALHLRKLGYRIGVNRHLGGSKHKRLKRLHAAGCVMLHGHKRGRWRQHLITVLRPRRFFRRLWPMLYTEPLDLRLWDLVVLSQGEFFQGMEIMQECMHHSIPYVLVVEACRPWGITVARHHSDQLRQCFEGAAILAFVSEENLALARAMLASPLKHAVIVRNPFLVSYGASPRWPSENVFRLACVARLEFQDKGQDILFEVLAQEKWRRRKLVVTLVGDGPDRETAERLKKLRKVHSIMIAGQRDGIESVWAKHHALILPSRGEGLPLAIVEAMLCGRPCIVTDVGGNAELLEDGVTGFIAPAATVKHVDAALERAWERRGKWREMGRRAATHVRKAVPRDPAKVFAEKLMKLAV